MYKNHAAVPQRYFELAELVGDGMADLGFEMDAGESMRRAFPEADAFHDNEALKASAARLTCKPWAMPFSHDGAIGIIGLWGPCRKQILNGL